MLCSPVLHARTCEKDTLLGNGRGVEATRAARLLRILEERREKGAMEVKEEGKARPSGVIVGTCCLWGRVGTVEQLTAGI